MKLFVIIFFILGSLITHTALSQKKSLLSRPFLSHIKKGPARLFLEDLNIRSGVIIEYASSSFDTERIIETDGTEETIGALLKKILTGQHVRLLEKNNKLLLVKSGSVINTDKWVPEYSLFGFIKEGSSGEPLINATVFELLSGKGTTTNPQGYFSLVLPAGFHRIYISYVGYREKVYDIDIKTHTRADIELDIKPEISVMKEVVVPASENIMKSGSEKIIAGQDHSFNYLLGENDPLRNSFLLPGVNHIPVSFNGLFVRGGSPGENLFLMDGNIVYNPTHMLGTLSIVNETSMKSMFLYKSDFPSKFGGATSSVLDIYTKDGNMEQWKGQAHAGTISGSFTVEGPIVKNKSAVMASYRHSWVTPLFKRFQKGIQTDFYDVHVKATQLLNRNNKLMINFYTGLDQFSLTEGGTDNFHKWGNRIGSVIWNRVIGAKSFVNTSVNMSHFENLGAFKYTFFDSDDEELESGSVGTFSSTEQYNVKSQAEINWSSKTKLNFGVQLAHVIIKPFESKISEEPEEDESAYTSFTPLPYDELSAYTEAELKAGKRFFLRPGLHFSAYRFRKNRFMSFQPRLFTSFKIHNYHRVYASFSRLSQYIHLVTNPYLSYNTDIWVPSTDKLQPEQSDSYTIGYEYKNSKGIKISLEGYWKDLKNVTNYAEGKSYFVNNDTWEQNIITGDGWAYGVEWMLRKTSGKLSLLATYTLAWSWRQFQNINHGKKFHYRFDRRHSFNAGLGYRFTKNLDASVLWTFSTGDIFSIPDYIYPDFDMSQQIASPGDLLNPYRFIYHSSTMSLNRTSPYHRLDAAVHFRTDRNKRIKWTLTAGVYNIYGSPDQYVYELRGSLGGNTILVENGVRTLDFNPYLSVTFNF